MKKILKVKPYGNLRVTKDAIRQSDIAPPGKKRPRIDSSETYVQVADFNNGERRMLFSLPLKRGTKRLLSPYPHPVLLYFSLAIKMIESAETIKAEMFQMKLKFNDQSVSMPDLDVDCTFEPYNAFLQSQVSGIIMLVCTLEAFINGSIPEVATHEKVVKGKVKTFKKNQIIKSVPFMEKMIDVIGNAYAIDFEQDHKRTVQSLKKLYEMRKNLVHLKSQKQDMFIESHIDVFKNIQSADLKRYRKSVEDYIDLINQDLLEYLNS